MRLKIVSISAAALVLAAPAAAHVTANPNKAAAGEFAKLDFRVPHGCEDSPTTSLTIKIPAGVTNVAPEVVPGWQLSVKGGKLPQAVTVHGEEVTEGVLEVTWSGGSLPPHFMTDFGMSLHLPEGPEGKMVWFPAVQRCAQGVTRWIQIPVEGQEEPDEPAPGVELIAAEGGGHGGAGASDGDQASRDNVGAESASSVATDEDDDDRANLALGLGAGGLLAGLAALGVSLNGRRRRA